MILSYGSLSPPKVLIASTSPWAISARLAIAFRELDWQVAAVSTHRKPLLTVQGVTEFYPYHLFSPERALSEALRRSGAGLVVPCDDTCVTHLHDIYFRLLSSSDSLAPVIMRSLGDPAYYSITESRAATMAEAQAIGVPIPDTIDISEVNSSALDAVFEIIGFPVVIKVDGSHGGEGVAVSKSPVEAKNDLQRLRRLSSSVSSLKRLVTCNEPFVVRQCLNRRRRGAIVQRLVQGRLANSLLASWKGDVISAIHVEVIHTRSPRGPATVVRLINRGDMDAIGRKLVRRLGLSGFVGLDFVIDDGADTALLIEINKRATTPAHLAVGTGNDPVAALASAVLGRPIAARPPKTTKDVVAYFPQAWQSDSNCRWLEEGYHDVPWTEPELVRELVKIPRTNRFAEVLVKLKALFGDFVT